MIRLDEELKLRKERALAIEAKLRAGVRPKDVAAEFGMSAAYVSKIARQCGIGPHGVNRMKHAAIAADYAGGFSIAEIMARNSCSRRVVWSACEALDVPLRRATSRSKPRGQSVVGREGAGVSDMRRIDFGRERDAASQVIDDPRSSVLDVQDELLHGRDDGWQVRRAESVESSTVETTVGKCGALRASKAPVFGSTKLPS